MKRIFSVAIGSVCSALLLTSCASYNAVALSNLSPMVIQSGQVNSDGIVVVAKAFTKGDCKKYLDRDVIAVGYQPVQLYIQNNSDKVVVFSPDRVSLPCVSVEEVAEKVHTSTVGRVVAYGVGSLFALPLVIPAVVDGFMSSKANDALNVDFSGKVASSQTIFPHSHFNKVIFVPSEEYHPSFSVVLIEGDSNQPKEMRVTVV